MTYEILLEPIATTALFGPYQVRQVSGRQIPGIETDSDGAIFTRMQQGQRLQYRVTSEIGRRPVAPSAANKTTVPAGLSDEVQANYLRLPENLPPRIRDLAAEITRDAKTPREKAIRIDAYLRKNYKYSLNLTWNPGDRSARMNFSSGQNQDTASTSHRPWRSCCARQAYRHGS